MAGRPLLRVLLALMLSACELGPEVEYAEAPGTTPVSQKADGIVCGGAETPTTCVLACGLHSTGEQPACTDGRWLCEQGVPDTSCPHFSGPCSPTTPCGYGYTCVKSLQHAVPNDIGICRKGDVLRDATLESCSEFGNTGPAELLDDSNAMIGQIIKMTGQLGVSLKCNDMPCLDGDPCCQACAGNYVMELTDPVDPRESISVIVRTEVLPCAGTNCDVSCSPLLVGDTYTLWGVLDGCIGAQCTILYMGGCPY